MSLRTWFVSTDRVLRVDESDTGFVLTYVGLDPRQMSLLVKCKEVDGAVVVPCNVLGKLCTEQLMPEAAQWS